MSKELDVKVGEFPDRRIDSEMPCLIVDTTYFGLLLTLKYVSKALFIVAGIGFEGCCEILGAKIVSTSRNCRKGASADLRRGLQGVKMAISDGHR
jgi:transposase-like protein